MTKRQLIDALDGYDDDTEVDLILDRHLYTHRVDYSIVHNSGGTASIWAVLHPDHLVGHAASDL